MGIASGDRDGRPNKRERAKAQRSRRASAAGEVDWTAFDWTAAACLTVEMVAVGGAIRFGATRDGGAWALGIYLGDDYATEYIRPAEDFTTALGEIASAWLPDKGAGFWERLTDARGSKR
jgi:hypothetical protein